jgi:hypothetical protein
MSRLKPKWSEITDLVNQAIKRLRRNDDLYFKLGKDVCMSSNLKSLNNVFLQKNHKINPWHGLSEGRPP